MSSDAACGFAKFSAVSALRRAHGDLPRPQDAALHQYGQQLRAAEARWHLALQHRRQQQRRQRL